MVLSSFGINILNSLRLLYLDSFVSWDCLQPYTTILCYNILILCIWNTTLPIDWSLLGSNNSCKLLYNCSTLTFHWVSGSLLVLLWVLSSTYVDVNSMDRCLPSTNQLSSTTYWPWAWFYFLRTGSEHIHTTLPSQRYFLSS